MSVAEYVDCWRRWQQGEKQQPLYLKDWHFFNEFPDYKVCQLHEHLPPP